MYKKYLHHFWTRIRPIKTWYLLAACLLFAVIHVAALRGNYVRMNELRNTVYAADKSNGNIEQALQELRAYVGSHMNTNLDTGNGVYPPVQLKYTYERLVSAEAERVKAANSKIYTDAQKYCERLDPNSFYGRERVPCIQKYIKAQGTATVKSIPDALYKFDFVSPRWSPDMAGWSLVLTLTLLVLGLTRFMLGYWLKSGSK